MLLTGCSEPPLYQQQSYVFGTLVEVSIYGKDEASAKGATGKVLADFDRMHSMLHPWKEGTLGGMNEVFARSPEQAALPPEMQDILEDATRLSAQSGGLFNPAIGNLIRLWGFHDETFQATLPDPDTVRKWVQAQPSMNDIVMENGHYRSNNPAIRVDLGGYAKGLALDRAVEILHSAGVEHALVNIGGNIIALGQHGSRAWKVGIRHPRKPGALATLELADGEAIGTTGDYQRYFEVDGKRYCHVIDPRSGYPAQGVQAVTVLIPKGRNAGVLSDVASKPAFIAGKVGWQEAIRQMGVDAAMLIDDQGEIQMTRAMKKRLTFQAASPKQHEIP
ncbi:MAG: FAD:protein FMN transferase [Sulfuricellaceae bacterium]|nr:FAD:protein FMN transferase [Sulfuricellaceae bacterium]